jgi:hypothetical protein
MVASGYFPAICARHGKPATQRISRKFQTRTPVWVVVLIILSLLIAVLVAMALRKTVTGQLPGCAECDRERSRFRSKVAGGWVATTLVWLVSLVTLNAFLLLVALVATLFALVFSFSEGYGVRGFLTQDQLWVQLKGLSPAFVNAVQAGPPQASPVPVPTDAGPAFPVPGLSMPGPGRTILPGG